MEEAEVWDMALANKGLVLKVVKEFKRTFPTPKLEWDDLVSAGMIAAWGACKAYDPAKDPKGTAFSTFLVRRVWQDLVREGKRLIPDMQWDRKTAIRPHLNLEELEEGHGGSQLRHSLLDHQGASAEAEALPKEVWDSLELLDPREKDFILRKYLLGMTHEQIGKTSIPRISKQRVTQIIDRALHKMRANAKSQEPA